MNGQTFAGPLMATGIPGIFFTTSNIDGRLVQAEGASATTLNRLLVSAKLLSKVTCKLVVPWPDTMVVPTGTVHV